MCDPLGPADVVSLSPSLRRCPVPKSASLSHRMACRRPIGPVPPPDSGPGPLNDELNNGKDARDFRASALSEGRSARPHIPGFLSFAVVFAPPFGLLAATHIPPFLPSR